MIRKPSRRLGLALFPALLLLGACDDSSTSSDQGGGSSGFYVLDTVAVDYKNAHNVAYLDFSTGTITHVAYDAWDIAIDVGGAGVIANCGVWGSGVRILKTSSTDIAADMSAQAASIKGIVDTAVNPFDGEITSAGAGSGKVYLIQDAAKNHYKVAFKSYGPMGKYSLRVAKGLAATSSTEVSGSIVADRGYTYIDLGTASDVSAQLPKADEWDVKFGRGLEFDMGGTLSARSAVLLNGRKGVEVAIVGKPIGEVTTTAGLSFSGDPLAIGASWYTFDHDSKTYTVNATTYVVKTVEGRFAKLQIRSFYGPNQEQFWSIVKYRYQAAGSTFPE